MQENWTSERDKHKNAFLYTTKSFSFIHGNRFLFWLIKKISFFVKKNLILKSIQKKNTGCFLEATFNWVDFISYYRNCNITGMLTMFADFWALTWGFNIALFFFIEVIFRPKSCSSLYCKMEWIEEFFTESCACSIFIVVTGFFTIFPLIFGLYGKAGRFFCFFFFL